MRSIARIASILLSVAGFWLALVLALPPLPEDQRAAIAGPPEPLASCGGVPDRPGCWFFGR